MQVLQFLRFAQNKDCGNDVHLLSNTSTHTIFRAEVRKTRNGVCKTQYPQPYACPNVAHTTKCIINKKTYLKKKEKYIRLELGKHCRYCTIKTINRVDRRRVLVGVDLNQHPSQVKRALNVLCNLKKINNKKRWGYICRAGAGFGFDLQPSQDGEKVHTKKNKK